MKLTVLSSFKHETIKIYVGEKTRDAEPYVIPKDILCKYQYFSKALSPPFVESQTGALHFPEDTEDAWSVIIYGLFNHEVEWPHAEESATKNLLSLTRAYVLADKYRLPAVQDEIAKAMMRGVQIEGGFPPEVMVEAISLMPSDCPLRWIILEKIVLMVKKKQRYCNWWEFAGLGNFPSVFEDLMMCLDEYNSNEDGTEFPAYACCSLGAWEMEKYWANRLRADEEDEEDEEEA